MNSPVQATTIWRGLGGACVGGLSVVILFGVVWAACNFQALFSPDAFDRHDEFARAAYQAELARAAHGVEQGLLFWAAVGASTGFASCYPAPRINLVWAFIAVFLATAVAVGPIMLFLERVGLEMRVSKGNQPDLLLSEAITFVLSPVLASVALVVVRLLSAMRDVPNQAMEQNRDGVQRS
jgi:hypothetical protein